MPTACALEPRALEQCQLILRQGSKSFAAASWLLPRRLRGPAAVIYTFCREADDAVDCDPAPLSALQRVGARLAQIYGPERPTRAVDAALADVVRCYGLPETLFRALLEGFAWDLTDRRYDTLDDLQAYAARVAGSVGVLMARLMGVQAPELLARACDLGIAMQLTNIARDVAEDATLGRLYLPRSWLREQGLDPDAWLARPSTSPALAPLVRRLLQAAAQLYERSDAGIAALPRDCRGGIYAARLIYADIGRCLRARAYDPFAGRAVVSGAAQALAVGPRPLGPLGRPGGHRGAPARARPWPRPCFCWRRWTPCP